MALPAANDNAGLPEYTDSELNAIGQRDVRYLVLVTQSLGGITAPLVCERVPVRALVLVNAMIPRPGERPGDWFVNTHHSEAKREQNVRDGRAPETPFEPLVDSFHDVPQSVIDEAAALGEPKQSDGVFASPCTFDSWPAIPIHVLVARENRSFPAALQQRIAHERRGVEAAQRVTADDARGLRVRLRPGVAGHLDTLTVKSPCMAVALDALGVLPQQGPTHHGLPRCTHTLPWRQRVNQSNASRNPASISVPG